MRTETLREAANEIRETWKSPEERTSPSGRFHLAVADWLDSAADEWEAGHMPIAYAGDVARAYLGEDA